ncbi:MULTISPECIES: sugar phosphate isomerase/epimerase [unclassified Curtobacterium]|uniref:sugar phosphate isomerase/epimerase family protein n=1 Tax=unclassified Curtobacterium TaxID=257496 RepID=UPI000DA71999|nr:MULTISPECIES: sugar phosphate isomerase/epimerase [unclassified Curtobacterium]PZE23118.1 sugar phosphate isomerase/epimerase [Curtobacterium sp. MCBD17_028]PZE77670.1 sugar phosphate isomerase/epimerase [Curtobacterium sp. MCBD17_019]PZF62972.1 sugar phosphate isomerase/epimerase [Curtobacterium sp. MCBD17_013]WIE54812.1 sugar phosphate isomerase/epimerase [Curtobacterium sp. MCBD17_003]
MPTTSVQLYSLRDAVAADLDAAVARVREIGYEHVEPYAFQERVDDYERVFAATGLTAPSGHAAVIDSEAPEAVFEAAVRLGITTVIDPFIPTDRWQTADDAKRLAERVNTLTEQAAGSGLRFGYHNHQWEFTNKVDGRPIYELFVEQLAPEVVLEVDTFWATVGGADAPAVLRGLGDRVVAIHVKDGKVTGDIATALPSSESALVVPDALKAAFENQTPAGQGDVDVAAILAAAPQALRVVEFDAYKGDVFEGIAESLAWLRENDH